MCLIEGLKKMMKFIAHLIISDEICRNYVLRHVLTNHREKSALLN